MSECEEVSKSNKFTHISEMIEYGEGKDFGSVSSSRHSNFIGTTVSQSIVNITMLINDVNNTDKIHLMYY